MLSAVSDNVCTLYVPKFFPSQAEYYFMGRYFMYGTLIQTNGHDHFLRVLMNSAETLLTKVG